MLLVDIHSALTFSDKDLKIESRVKIYNAKMAKLEMACELGCLKKIKYLRSCCYFGMFWVYIT